MTADERIRDLNSQATVLQQQKRWREAIALFDEALAIGPGNASLHFNKANVLATSGNQTLAIPSYKQAIKLNPNHWKARLNLAHAQYAVGNLGAAERTLRNCANRAPRNDADIQFALGKWFAKLDQFEKARTHYEASAAASPPNREAMIELAAINAQLGDMAPAVALCRQALSSGPATGRAYHLIARLDPQSLNAHDIAVLRDLAEDKTKSGPDRRMASFALGRYYERADKHDDAFAWFVHGNRLRRSSHDPQQHQQLCDRLMESFNADLIAAKQVHGNATERPIFIIGMPRSGTTLCEQIIASHPQAAGVGELDELKNLTTQIGSSTYPENIAKLTRSDVARLAARYLKRIDQLAGSDALRIADKWPTNFLHLGFIAILFCNARVVHCQRDPLDTCLSIFTENFTGVAYSNDLQHIGSFYRQYRRLMTHWTKVLPVTIFNLSYESLVENQEKATRDLLEFCGLDWNPACLDFHSTKRAVKTTSMQQVRQPLYSRSVGRWKKFQRHLDPLRHALTNRS